LNLGKILLAAMLMPSLLLAQPSWEATAPKEEAPLELFHEVMTPNFPTAQMLYKGDFHYEISHRFFPPIDEGYDSFFGFDGPANIRMALSYGLSDRTMLTFGRSNVLDNLDLQVKHQLLDIRSETLPGKVAVRAGLAWNTDIPAIVDRGKFDGANFQYYAQLVYNTMLLDGKLGIGVVPSYLYNSTIFSVDKQYTFTLGNYYQYHINDLWGLWLEYNPAIAGYQGIIAPGETGRSHDSLGLGVSIETGGHFFYVFATNNTRLNPSQYLVGAPDDASPKNWRVAFGITRHL
jgi:hypothetical protein